MEPSSRLPTVKQIWQPAKSNLIGRGIGALHYPKESLGIRKPLHNLRRSKSFSDLQAMRTESLRRPMADRNGPLVHPLLPKPNAIKSYHSSIAPIKENKPIGRSTLTIKRPGGNLNANATAAKQPRQGNLPLGSQSATKAVIGKKIAPYDYKARFNDLLEKHKPMKADYAELKRSHDVVAEELAEYKTKWETYSVTLEELKHNTEKDRITISKLSTDLSEITSKYEKLLKEKTDLEEKISLMTEQLNSTTYTLRETTDKLNKNENIRLDQEQLIAKQIEDLEELQESTQRLHWERRSLHNKLQDMKGNIRVVFRVRPALAAGRPVAALSFPDACTIELERMEPGAHRRQAKHDFKFDRVFGPTSNQEDVWEEVSCLVQSALDGYNVCIFAYGQTGSGKTYTMEGSPDAPGVIPRTCTMLFESIKQLSKSGWEYAIHASFLEIYNEQLYDLLQPSRDPRELDIRMVDAKGSDVYVTNLTEQEVTSAPELLRLAYKAQQNRQTAATAGNERSSRSHSVARIRLAGQHPGKSLSLTARMCLVDLAGSESAKLTQRLKETKNINRSLSELGQVILALQQKQEHVPFRNSKLTRLLEPQLGGAAKALLVAAAAPYEDCGHESLSTLRFATQVGSCSTASARRNIALANPTAAPSNGKN